MRFLACIFLLLTTFVTHAEIYKWVDAQGKVHYSDKKDAVVKSATIKTQPKLSQEEKANISQNGIEKDTKAVESAQAEFDKLELAISKQQERYLKGPREVFVGARTKDQRIAPYLQTWQKKIEKIGNDIYPEEAKAKNCMGKFEQLFQLKQVAS